MTIVIRSGLILLAILITAFYAFSLINCDQVNAVQLSPTNEQISKDNLFETEKKLGTIIDDF
ncbi:hypothetical protein [Companilactobacillus sp.]|jgi:hypothetical protein|uniref:hypothetical protein n=1 Tax=Companilactobacillus sp. TaxID=2767905 RepID=UPI0025BDEDA1|nr:hypothetical protein [Companilactobacillus sp.]MCH4007907.1 hypothetical protein [Companilactobacillus sp.]MCH4051914.1 hypothetical protein [Companilactobacillus sp.]MCH4075850.1 hypothetical protein [Companilactobacillus sp.]MCH4124425.1 hypothetical protein [Companilactobacillus sp.]MCH4132612.1 hypothetical protein [Companilactobacillus sp.]